MASHRAFRPFAIDAQNIQICAHHTRRRNGQLAAQIGGSGAPFLLAWTCCRGSPGRRPPQGPGCSLATNDRRSPRAIVITGTMILSGELNGSDRQAWTGERNQPGSRLPVGTPGCPRSPPAPGRARGLAHRGAGGEGSYTPGRVAQPGSLPGLDRGLPVVCCTGRAQKRLMRVVATRIEQDGTMQRAW